MRRQNFLRRALCMLAGVIITGFGVSLCVQANLGTDPCTTMNLGISGFLNIPFSFWQIGLNVAILIVVFFLDKSLIGLGTVGNMILVGLSADAFRLIWEQVFVKEDLSLAVRITFTFVGILCSILGTSLYMTAKLGIAPYDCVAILIVDRTKFSYKWVRMIQDAIALAIGFSFGATVGAATVVMVLLLGPLIPLCNKYVSVKIVGGEPEKTN